MVVDGTSEESTVHVQEIWQTRALSAPTTLCEANKTYSTPEWQGQYVAVG